MAYSDKDLIYRYHKRFCITPFTIEHGFHLTPVGYDLTVGAVIVLGDKIEENVDEYLTVRDETDDDGVDIEIPSRTGAIIITHEAIYNSGRSLATVHGRSRMTARGFILNSITIDPNFEGKIIVYLYNSTAKPQKIKSNDRILTLIFHGVETETGNTPHTNTHDLIEFYGDLYGAGVSRVLLRYFNNWMESKYYAEFQESIQKVKNYRNKSKIRRRFDRYFNNWKNMFGESDYFKFAALSAEVAVPIFLGYILLVGYSPYLRERFWGPLPAPDTTEALALYVAVLQALVMFIAYKIFRKK